MQINSTNHRGDILVPSTHACEHSCWWQYYFTRANGQL